MPAINTQIRDANFGEKVLLSEPGKPYAVEVIVTNEYFHHPGLDPALYRRVISPLPNAEGKFDFGIRVYQNIAEYYRTTRGHA
ncbi:hypothetical protein [Spongiibacter sp. UBA1325]|uniref:hypothetical protein n=1 Tax=Spongiibacter sp. UBA1325 TaxID=1947543 RepID=UPI00257CF670|nr:hypothetical protein [Spongiibacter sp. UBA1325]|tara:strand:- start:795 stop:1043 length:249 start_codon:yes stop_codon:yes gene_type:complete